MKQLILAGDVYQYRLYLLKKMLKEEDTVFIMGVGDLLGRNSHELAIIIRVGTWYKREYANIMPIQRHLFSRGIDFEHLTTDLI